MELFVWEDGGLELFERTVVWNCSFGRIFRYSIKLDAFVWEDGGVELFGRTVV